MSPALDGARRIALTFDDAPTGPGAFFSGAERTARIVGHLSEAGVAAAMFFVRTDGIASHGGAARLAAYVAAGQALANHGHSHLALSKTPLDRFVDDLDRAADALDGIGPHAPFFRYPYLDEGRALEVQTRMAEALEARGLRPGHVSVCTYDFYLQDLVDQHLARGVRLDMDGLGAVYCDLMVRSAAFYERVARESLGRTPAHILLLHENDLAALYLGRLIAALRTEGWRIVPAQEAYADPVYALSAETTFRNQGHIAALAHAGGAKRRDLVPLEEEEDHIAARFSRECVAPE